MTNNAGAKRGSIAILHHVGGGNLGDDAEEQYKLILKVHE